MTSEARLEARQATQEAYGHYCNKVRELGGIPYPFHAFATMYPLYRVKQIAEMTIEGAGSK